MRLVCSLLVMAALLTAVGAGAADWPQWRGPDRNGVAPQGPALAARWPATGPKLVWKSDTVAGDEMGGFGCPVVADGRVYLFVNWKTRTPIPQRVLPENGLVNLGWTPKPPPDDILAAADKARLSDEREAIKDWTAQQKWADAWVKANLTDEQRKQFGQFLKDRIAAGRRALRWDLLTKLVEIKGKTFDTQADLDKWFADNGVTKEEARQIMGAIPVNRDDATDTILALNATNGTQVWRTEYPGQATTWGSSSTACVTNGRVYVAGHSSLFCLDATTGKEIWVAAIKGSEISSSPVVVDGVVILHSGQIAAFDADKGSALWRAKGYSGGNSSPALWHKDGRTYIVSNGGGKVYCLDPKDGKVMWNVPGGSDSTPAIVGDDMVVQTGQKDPGAIAYKLSLTEATKVWNVPFSDRGCSPLIAGDNVFLFGGEGGPRGGMCVDLKSGKVAWEEKVPGHGFSSPVFADGKILQVMEGKLALVEANPAAYKALAIANLGTLRCSSAALVDGKAYVRLTDKIACYDLTAQ